MVPAKLFTLFHDDRRALAHFARARARIAAALRRIEGCREWGVQLRLSIEEARRHVRQERQAPAGMSGTQFLRARKHETDRLRGLREGARERARALYSELAGHAEFLDRVRSLSDEHSAQGLRFRVTGPWPAYHFA